MKLTIASLIAGIFISHTPAFAAVLAEVNGQKITDQDLRSVVSKLNPGQQREILKDPIAKASILESIIDQKLLLAEAKKKRIAQMREYTEAIEALKKQTLINVLISKEIDRKVTKKSARRFYDENKLEFRTDQVRAFHILVKELKKADRIAAQAKRKGTKFEDLVMKHSEDPSKKQNKGDLGYFPRDRFPRSFTGPVFKASKGEIVGPVRTNFGFHVVKVLDKDPGKQISFKDSEIKARASLKQKLLQKYASDLRKKAKLKIFHKNIR